MNAIRDLNISIKTRATNFTRVPCPQCHEATALKGDVQAAVAGSDKYFAIGTKTYCPTCQSASIEDPKGE